MEQSVDTITTESGMSGVSWQAVAAGAFVAAAVSLSLVALGTGLGLASVSPWANEGASAKTLGVASIIWLIFMQIAAGSLGAYVAGRLRTKWVRLHTDEVFFRDTAHGFLVWAVGLVITAAFLTSAVGTLAGAGAKTGAAAISAAGGAAAATAASQGGISRSPMQGGDIASIADPYLVDTLFRTDKPSGSADMASVRSEVGHIFSANKDRDFASQDRTYLAQLVSARTGLSQAEAEKRVSEVVAKAKEAETKARQAADEARKAAMHASLWMFLALLIGAFCASYAATIGGKHRDD